MIVSCEYCATRFKFDEQRIKPKGIKVHCSRCRRTFVLKHPDTPVAPAETEQVAPDLATQAELPSPVVDTAGADSAALSDPEVFEDDPLADVPGFDPDDLPSSVNDAAAEEEKALEALARDDQLDAGVAQALDRFGAPPFDAGEGEEEAAGEDVAESADLSADADLFDAAGLTDDEAGEETNDDQADLPSLEGEAAKGDDSFGTPVEFDWDQVSFSKGKEAASAGAEESETEPAVDGEDDTSFFTEPTVHEKQAPPSLASVEADSAKAFETESLELDLRNVSSRPGLVKPAPAPVAPAAAKARPAPAVDSSRRDAAATPKKAKAVVVPPLRMRARPERAALALPGISGLILSIGLGLVAAGAGAILAYTPSRGGAELVRPAGGAAGSTALLVEDTRSITVDRLQGPSLYLVTGKARWKGPSQALAYLEGVITDDAGKILERRPARLGELPNWKTIEAVDPDLFAPHTPLPADGETPFSLLFAPDPTWRGEVHFELRTGE
ncbi:MAG: zinc-ribbon domain-containing protein [Deltaproteobacteria bacterium]|nr:zinc-ribbon domain-containing protein [Deltaproteobacteria bacterium]